MCGIVGVYGFERAYRVDPELLLSQTDRLAHRGPDDGAAWIGDGVGLGHRRLSIIDLGGGHQPMWDAEGRFGVVFNGEIYNYRELRRELEREGHVFATDSDTETIIHGFRAWGEACVARFAGMFAFAVFDRVTRRMLLARDRLGKKPLYWYADEERLVFGSELKAIIEDPRVPRSIEPEAVVDYFAYNYVPGPRTIFQHLHKLPPGHLLLLSGRERVLREYWDVDFSRVDHGPSIEEQAAALDTAARRAVELRLRSDVPLGAFLSGGVDSSYVVGLMAEQLTEPALTHTVGFAEAAYDERAYARETSRLFGTRHFEQVVAVDALGVLDRLAWHYDEPFGDSSAIPTYYLCEATRQRVTVALSGDGGDESFAGYRRYKFALYERQVRERVPALLRRRVVAPLARLYPKADYLPRFLRAKATLTNIATTHDRAYFLSLTQKSYPRLLSRDFLGGLAGYDPYTPFERCIARARTDDPLARLQYADLKMYLADDILVKVDRASMAHALEGRVPLLDHAVVELGARMPSSMKLEGSAQKRVLKKAAARLLPPSVFERPKQGFTVPIPAWLRSGLRERAEEVFFGRPGGRSGLLDERGLRGLWREHQLGVRDHSTTLWSTLMFESWAARFLAPSAPMPLPPGARPTVLDPAPV